MYFFSSSYGVNVVVPISLFRTYIVVDLFQ